MLKKYKNLRQWMGSAVLSAMLVGACAVMNTATFAIEVPAKVSDENASQTATITVDSTSDSLLNTCTEAPDDCTLRGAIFKANSTLADDTITFAIPAGDLGCFGGVCTINLPLGELHIQPRDVAGNLTINGMGATQIRISGGDLNRIFSVEAAANSTLENITLSNGKAHAGSSSEPGRGGCIYNRGRVNLVKSTVTSCTATRDGGGIYNTGVLSVTDSTIRDNSADSSGTTNGASGGGILNKGFAILDRSTITANRAIVSGGGQLALGGGVVNFGSVATPFTLHVINSTISGNIASGTVTNNQARGGGIYSVGGGSGSTVYVVNSTITGNTASIPNLVGNANGGGIFTADSAAPSVKNTIIAGNSVIANNAVAPDAFGNFASGGYNLIGKFDGATGFNSVGDQLGSVFTPLDARLAPLAYIGGPTLTHALCTGAGAPHANCTGVSPAIDKGTAADDPVFELPIVIDQRGQARPFDNQPIPSAPGGNNSDIGAFESRPRTTPFDFDGDAKTDVSIFRPSSGQWWYQRSSNGGVPAVQFGTGADKIVPGDFTGDGKTDIAFWRPSDGNWFIIRSEDGTFFAFPFGATGDIPAPADYDADGRADAAVFRPSSATWFILNSGGGTSLFNFGLPTDKPVVADYDGDAKADIAIWRSGPGEWWLRRSTTGTVVAVQFGVTTDRPVPGDFTGDGKADIAFWRPADGNWFIIRSEDSSFFAFPFGSAGDIPAPGDYDGDGRLDAAVFRPSAATWFLNRSTAGVGIQQFGIPTDTPVPSAFVP